MACATNYHTTTPLDSVSFGIPGAEANTARFATNVPTGTPITPIAAMTPTHW